MKSGDEFDAAVVMKPAAESSDRFRRLQKSLRSESAERADDPGVHDRDLAEDEFSARLDFVLLRIPVSRWTAFDNVADEHVFAIDLHRLNDFCQELACPPDEREALRVFVRSRSLTHKHQLRPGIPRAKDNAPPRRRELAAPAILQVGTDGVE